MINISCAELMSYAKTFNYWGDIFNYNSVSSYTVNGRVSGDPNLSGIYYAWSGMQTLINSGLAYQDFVINGVNFGTGKVTSLNFEEGNDLQYKKYQMSFDIFETGRLYNLTGSNYSEIPIEIFDSNFAYFNNFQENIQISVGENGIQETSQSLSFEIDDPVAFKNTARNTIFSGFSKYRIPRVNMFTAFPNIITGNINSGYITRYNESYDLNGRYSFDKRSSYNANQKGTWEYFQSFDYDGGDITVTENGVINSIFFQGTGIFKNLSGARDRWNEVSGTIFSRVSGLYFALSDTTGILSGVSQCPLINFPVSKQWQENPFEGTIEYAYSYSNSPIYTSSGYIFTNSRQASVDEDGYYLITENGEYQGTSPNTATRFIQASGGYFGNTGSVYSRISGTLLLATGLNGSGCATSGQGVLTNTSVTFEEFYGKISYTNSYATNPSYYTGNSNFFKYTNTISDNRPVHLKNNFLVPFVGEIAQSAEQSTEGGYSNAIEIFGKTGLSIDSYLTEAFTKVVKPSGSGIFLKAMTYNFDPFNNVFRANFDYSYSKYRSRNNILI